MSIKSDLRRLMAQTGLAAQPDEQPDGADHEVLIYVPWDGRHPDALGQHGNVVLYDADAASNNPPTRDGAS